MRPTQWPTGHANIDPMPRSDFTPSDEAAKLYARHKRAYETVAELKEPVRRQAAEDLRAGATVGQLARWTGLTAEVVRRIAREEGIERLRPPTVGRLAADDD